MSVEEEVGRQRKRERGQGGEELWGSLGRKKEKKKEKKRENKRRAYKTAKIPPRPPTTTSKPRQKYMRSHKPTTSTGMMAAETRSEMR